MKAFIKYSSGDESIVENFQYLLMSSNSGNTKVSKEDVSSKVFSSGKRYTFVGDRTVSTVSPEFLISIHRLISLSNSATARNSSGLFLVSKLLFACFNKLSFNLLFSLAILVFATCVLPPLSCLFDCGLYFDR